MMTEEQKEHLRKLALQRNAAKREAAQAEAEAAHETLLQAMGQVPEVVVDEADEADEEIYVPPVTVAEGGVPITEPMDDEEVEAVLSPFERWVSALDAETRDLLDDDDLEEIWAAQQSKAKAEKKASAKKAATAHALQTARIAEGVIAPKTAAEIEWRERMDEKVGFAITMPHVGDGVADIGLRIDQRVYLDGTYYPDLTRAEMESMRYNLYLAGQNELLFEGRDKRHWLRRQAVGAVDGRIN